MWIYRLLDIDKMCCRCCCRCRCHCCFDGSSTLFSIWVFHDSHRRPYTLQLSIVIIPFHSNEFQSLPITGRRTVSVVFRLNFNWNSSISHRWAMPPMKWNSNHWINNDTSSLYIEIDMVYVVCACVVRTNIHDNTIIHFINGIAIANFSCCYCCCCCRIFTIDSNARSHTQCDKENGMKRKLGDGAKNWT